MKSKATPGSRWYSEFRSRQSGHVGVLVLDKHNHFVFGSYVRWDEFQSRRSVSSLGHDGTGEHEHARGDELHDPAQHEVKNPISCDGVHLGECGVVHRLCTEDVVCRPGGHDGVGDSNTEEWKGDTDTNQELQRGQFGDLGIIWEWNVRYGGTSSNAIGTRTSRRMRRG